MFVLIVRDRAQERLEAGTVPKWVRADLLLAQRQNNLAMARNVGEKKDISDDGGNCLAPKQ